MFPLELRNRGAHNWKITSDLDIFFHPFAPDCLLFPSTDILISSSRHRLFADQARDRGASLVITCSIEAGRKENELFPDLDIAFIFAGPSGLQCGTPLHPLARQAAQPRVP